MMLRSTPRNRAVLAAATVMLLGVSSFALADEHSSTTTVSTETTQPSRQLEVLDVAGDPLEEMRLHHDRAKPFEVRVTDTDQAPDNQFTVDATMNNLYLAGSEDDADHIPSGQIDLGFTTNPLAAAGLSVDLEPTYLLSGEIGCDLLDGLSLSLDGLLGGDPICGLLTDLGLADSATVEFAGVPLVGELLDDLDLDGLELPSLPLVPGHGNGGPFTDPNCTSGLGEGRCTSETATALQALRGDQTTDADELLALLEDALDEVGDLVGEDGLTTVDDVIAALLGSDVPLGSLDGTVADLGQALGDYSPSDQVDVINGLFEAVLDDLGLADLLHLTGRYSSFPTLTVDTDGAPAGGEYEGTLTVTLIE